SAAVAAAVLPKMLTLPSPFFDAPTVVTGAICCASPEICQFVGYWAPLPTLIGKPLVQRVEIRNAAGSFRIPGIDDLAAESAFRSDAIGVGGNIYRLRIGVVEVE